MKRNKSKKIGIIIGSVLLALFVLFVLPLIILQIRGKILTASGNNDTVFSAENDNKTDNPAPDDDFLEQKSAREECRSVGVILSETPDELIERTKYYYEGRDSINQYYGASEPIKVAGTQEEFIAFCDEFFFDHTEPVQYIKWANEVYQAICEHYIIYRTELFNPDESPNGLKCIMDIGGGESLDMNFVYDSSGKYALLCYDYDETVACAMAKFIGLQFNEQYPYVSPIDDELNRLSVRSQQSFDNIWNYTAQNTVVRVKSTDEEFRDFCYNLFENTDQCEIYENIDGEAEYAVCGDNYMVFRTQFFTPISYHSQLYYEGYAAGDTQAPRYQFFYDSTGKYALILTGWDDYEYNDAVCMKFLEFDK